MNQWGELLPTLLEVCRVLGSLPRVESARRCQGPRPLLEGLRRRARSAPKRDPRGRERLRRAIRWVDAWIGGGNCYRRSLLEIALDRGAAAEPFLMGFTLAGEQLSGHAWVAAEGSSQANYQFTVQL